MIAFNEFFKNGLIEIKVTHHIQEGEEHNNKTYKCKKVYTLEAPKKKNFIFD